jgi:hypothetical protein
MNVFKPRTSTCGFSFSLALVGLVTETLGQAVMHDFRFYEGGVSKRTNQARRSMVEKVQDFKVHKIEDRTH